MASEIDAVWPMLQQVASRNKTLPVLQRKLKSSFEALSKNHISTTSKFRQKRALAFLHTIYNHPQSNGAVFVAGVLLGYTVLATLRTADPFFSWYEANIKEPFIQLAFEAYGVSTVEVDNLLKHAKTLGASGASAHRQAQLESKQVLASGASAHAHIATQPELPQDLNMSSTLVHTQPQIDLRHNAQTDTQPQLPRDLNTSSNLSHAQINFGQSLGTSSASAHAHTDTQPELPQDLITSSTLAHTQPQIDLRHNAHTDTQPELPHDLITSSTLAHTQPQIERRQSLALGQGNPQLWSTQVHSFGPSTHAAREQPGDQISFESFVDLVQSLANQQLKPEIWSEGGVMRGIAFRVDNVMVGYWSMSEQMAHYAYLSLCLMSYAPS